MPVRKEFKTRMDEKDKPPESDLDNVIRPEIFMALKKSASEEVWNEETVKEKSNSYKERYIESISHDIMFNVLRQIQFAGIGDFEEDDIKILLLTMHAIQSVMFKNVGLEHPFHELAEKLVAEPDDATKNFIIQLIFRSMFGNGNAVVYTDEDDIEDV